MGNGKSRQLPLLWNPKTGETREAPISNSRLIDDSIINRVGAAIIPQKMNSKQVSYQTKIAGPIQYAEKPYGEVSTVRQEEASAGESRRVLTISITNTEATAETVALFDGLGHVKRMANIAVPKAGVTFDGTFGADTYTVLQELGKMVALKFKGIKFQAFTSAGAKADTYFTAGSFRSAVADPLQYNLDNPYESFTDLVGQNSFNTNIRQNDQYRFLMTPTSAWIVTLPTATAVTITATVDSYEGSFGMVRFTK